MYMVSFANYWTYYCILCSFTMFWAALSGTPSRRERICIIQIKKYTNPWTDWPRAKGWFVLMVHPTLLAKGSSLSLMYLLIHEWERSSFSEACNVRKEGRKGFLGVATLNFEVPCPGKLEGLHHCSVSISLAHQANYFYRMPMKMENSIRDSLIHVSLRKAIWYIFCYPTTLSICMHLFAIWLFGILKDLLFYSTILGMPTQK